MFCVILQAELERIHPQLVGELVHPNLDRNEPDAFERRPHRRRIAAVDAHQTMRRADRGTGVQGAGAYTDALDVIAHMRACHEAVVPDARQASRFLRADRERLNRRGLIAVTGECLSAGEHELHGHAELARGHGREELVGPDPTLAAESTADIGVPHPYSARIDLQRAGNHFARIDDALYRVEQCELATAPDSERCRRLDGAMMSIGRAIRVLQANVRCLPSRGHVADRRVGLPEKERASFAVFQTGREVRFERLLSIGHRHVSGGFQRGFERSCNDERDRLPLVEHLVALQRQQILAERQARDFAELRRIEVREDANHARRGLRCLGVDPHDACMRTRRTDDHGM